MASIDVGAGTSRGGRKSVDAQLSLIPCIDLLLCCVMFLLMTAVWNALASQAVEQHIPGQASAIDPVDEPLRFFVQLDHSGYIVGSTAGDKLAIPFSNGDYDREGLREKLSAFRAGHPALDRVDVLAEDGVQFDSIIATVDVLKATGFASVSLSES